MNNFLQAIRDTEAGWEKAGSRHVHGESMDPSWRVAGT